MPAEDALRRAWRDGYEAAVNQVRLGGSIVSGPKGKTCRELERTLTATRDDFERLAFEGPASSGEQR